MLGTITPCASTAAARASDASSAAVDDGSEAAEELPNKARGRLASLLALLTRDLLGAILSPAACGAADPTISANPPPEGGNVAALAEWTSGTAPPAWRGTCMTGSEGAPVGAAGPVAAVAVAGGGGRPITSPRLADVGRRAL